MMMMMMMMMMNVTELEICTASPMNINYFNIIFTVKNTFFLFFFLFYCNTKKTKKTQIQPNMEDNMPPKDKDPHTWTHEEVGAYLRSMNLADKYVQVFIDEDINGMVLMNLTRDELKEEPFFMKTFAPIKTVTATISTLKQQLEQRQTEAVEATPQNGHSMLPTSVPERKLIPEIQPPPGMMEGMPVLPVNRQIPVHPFLDFPPTQLDFNPQYFTASNVAYPLLPPPPLFEHGMNPDFLPKKAFFAQLDQKYGNDDKR